MGLRQEAETSLGNQSGRCLPHPAVAGLSRFEARLSRRSIILGAATAGILTAVGIPLRARAQVESPVDIDKEQLLSDAVTSWSTQAVKEEALGELFELTGIPLSLGFYDQVGYSKLFQSMLVTLDQDNNPVLRNLLTEEEQNGFDTYNVPPFLGDAAPKKGVFTINPSDQVKQKVAALGRVFGLDLTITGADQFAGYSSFRIGDNNGDIGGLVEDSDGTIRMAQFASLASQAGVVPQEVMLAYGELATGGGTQIEKRALSPAEQILAENTRLIGSKSYDLGDRSITVEVRAGQDSPVYFGLQGNPDNQTSIPGVPDQLTDEAANMFIVTGQYRAVNHLTLVTLKPNDPLFNQLPENVNKTYAPMAFTPAVDSPQIMIAAFGGELTDNGSLTFVIEPVAWEPNNQTRITGLKMATAESLAGALINGGQNGFLPIEFSQAQNKAIVDATRTHFENIVKVST